MAGPRCIEIAGPERVRKLMLGCNVNVIRKRKTGVIVEIQVQQYGDDSRMPSRWNNPQKLSHNHATPNNPAGVWMLKRLRSVFDPARELV